MNDFSSNTKETKKNMFKVPSFFSRNKIKRSIKRSVALPFVVVGIIVVGIIAFLFIKAAHTSSNAQAATVDTRVAIPRAKATETLNKIFNFSLKDQSGKEVSKFTYEIQSAELDDEIIVKGQKATAIKGRTFLILNLKIVNNYTQTIQINARDYVRLSVNNADEKLAADIHNDPVEVQAISTKYTRIGFPINDTDKNLKLQVGEITGDKSTVKLNLK